MLQITIITNIHNADSIYKTKDSDKINHISDYFFIILNIKYTLMCLLKNNSFKRTHEITTMLKYL